MAGLPDATVARFRALFSGFTKNYGTYRIRGRSESGKVDGQAATEEGATTLDLVARHLAGEQGLGIIPLREDNTVLFGAIDVDDKKMDHAAVVAKIAALGVPATLCRSKSGGGHLYFFFASPLDAATFRRKAALIVSLLGYSKKTEVFPKQSSRKSDIDVGNWINLPYFDVAKTNRFAFGPGGVALSLEDFLNLAESRKVTPDEFEAWEPQTTAEDVVKEILDEAPPCLTMIYRKGGAVEGSRNNLMFNVCVYLKKRFGDEWEDHVYAYHTHFIQDPLKITELHALIHSLRKKTYNYQCGQAPICDHCNKRACLEQKFGVGEAGTDEDRLELGSLIRYQPPDPMFADEVTWRVEINGAPVMVTTTELLSPSLFNRSAMNQANIHIGNFSQARWSVLIQELTKHQSTVPLPHQATPAGQLTAKIREFTESMRADSLERLMLGGAFVEDGKAFFLSGDLFKYLENARVQWKTHQHVWHLITQRMKGGETEVQIKGRRQIVWWIPASEEAQNVTPIGSLERDIEL